MIRDTDCESENMYIIITRHFSMTDFLTKRKFFDVREEIFVKLHVTRSS
jgi:hypothetical protein